MQNDGLITDAGGNKVLAIAWDHKGAGSPWFTTRRQLLIDPDTSNYRGIRVLDYALVAENKETDNLAVISQGIVDKAGHVPGG